MIVKKQLIINLSPTDIQAAIIHYLRHAHNIAGTAVEVDFEIKTTTTGYAQMEHDVHSLAGATAKFTVEGE